MTHVDKPTDVISDHSFVAVTVFSCKGIGYVSGVVTALEWVRSNVEMPAVVSMSLGGAAAPKLDAATQSLTDIGVTVVVAGGNSAAGAALLLCHPP